MKLGKRDRSRRWGDILYRVMNVEQKPEVSARGANGEKCLKQKFKCRGPEVGISLSYLRNI